MRDRYTRYPRTILWLIPGGRVTPGGEPGDSEPAAEIESEVEIEPFYISKFPITNEQFEAFDPGFEPSLASPGERDPATGVSFHDAEEYCRWYGEVSRKPMRLPTEEEWEHACRGGSGERLFCGDEPTGGDAHAWHRGNSGEKVSALDAKKANGFGLFAMLGGIWEWVDAAGEPILRGGSFRTEPGELSCALRRPVAQGECFDDAGFRVVKSLR